MRTPAPNVAIATYRSLSALTKLDESEAAGGILIADRNVEFVYTLDGALQRSLTAECTGRRRT